MPITNTDKVKNAFYNYVIEQVEGARIGAINALNYVGLQCVTEARKNGRYTDQTGNLRSSIGYAIIENGKVISKSGFEKVRGQGENYQLVNFKTKQGKSVKYWTKGKTGDGTEGSNTGQAFINRLASTYKNGLVLVVVAGMDYAAYVEARGYNVLNSAETLAKTLVPEMLKQLGLIK